MKNFLEFIKIWFKEFRIHHWVKNIFVFVPLFFSGKFININDVLKSLYFFILFCLLSSSVYILNDIADLKKDQAHPTKKNRPIAAGQISPLAACIVAIILCSSGLSLAFLINLGALLFLLTYFGNNLLYILYLKHKVIADVISISIGFMIRFIGGAYVINVVPSRWLLVCGFALSLFLAFGKRRTELELINGNLNEKAIRPALESYSKEKLNSALSVVNSLCILTYILYVTDPATINIHQSNQLIYTVPIVVYCLFRYMYKVQEGKGSGPIEIIFKDKAFIGAILSWCVLVFVILYK